MIKRHQFGLRLAAILSGMELSNVKREDGQTLVEYALILALIAVVVAATLMIFATDIGNEFSNIASKL